MVKRYHQLYDRKGVDMALICSSICICPYSIVLVTVMGTSGYVEYHWDGNLRLTLVPRRPGTLRYRMQSLAFTRCRTDLL